MNALKWLILSLALILSAVVAAPAAARTPNTSCVDELSNLTIAGDLTVPRGEVCVLVNVTVLGSARVNERSSLQAIGGLIEGGIAGAGFESVRLQGTSVGGRIRLNGGSAVELERVIVTGDVRLIDQIDTRVRHSHVNGGLTIRGARELALFCGTTVEGDARFADHRGGLLIGDDPFFATACGGNVVQGDLRVHHNQADSVVANTSVGRNLVCAANSPAPLVYGNQVSGKARGQCGAGEPIDSSELGDNGR